MLFWALLKKYLIQIKAVKMAAMSDEEDAMLVSQCLDFCQMLAGKSLSFSFSLTLGTSFSFSVDTMGKGDMVPQKKKKKPTPSTQRRNARRREEFLKKKVNASTEKKLSSPGEPGHPLVACILCSVFTHYTVYSFKELCSEAQLAGSVDYSLHSVYYTVYSKHCAMSNQHCPPIEPHCTAL